jgi:Family of unknown function (DUF5397)
MASRGFEETQAGYEAGRPQSLIGQIRRLGTAGPAYEVMKVDDNDDVHIEVIASGEMAIFPLAEILEDPMAETIP